MKENRKVMSERSASAVMSEMNGWRIEEAIEEMKINGVWRIEEMKMKANVREEAAA
jgi:hypothetical protein